MPVRVSTGHRTTSSALTRRKHIPSKGNSFTAHRFSGTCNHGGRNWGQHVRLVQEIKLFADMASNFPTPPQIETGQTDSGTTSCAAAATTNQSASIQIARPSQSRYSHPQIAFSCPSPSCSQQDLLVFCAGPHYHASTCARTCSRLYQAPQG
jgi:hypothetical protein